MNAINPSAWIRSASYNRPINFTAALSSRLLYLPATGLRDEKVRKAGCALEELTYLFCKWLYIWQQRILVRMWPVLILSWNDECQAKACWDHGHYTWFSISSFSSAKVKELCLSAGFSSYKVHWVTARCLLDNWFCRDLVGWLCFWFFFYKSMSSPSFAQLLHFYLY